MGGGAAMGAPARWALCRSTAVAHQLPCCRAGPCSGKAPLYIPAATSYGCYVGACIGVCDCILMVMHVRTFWSAKSELLCTYNGHVDDYPYCDCLRHRHCTVVISSLVAIATHPDVVAQYVQVILVHANARPVNGSSISLHILLVSSIWQFAL